MTKKKQPGDGKSSDANAGNYERQNRYHRNRQPKDMERWTHQQFQQWVADMGFPDAPESFVIPYDVPSIADALKCHTKKVYLYWRGHEGSREVTIPPGVVGFCKALLELKRLRGGAP